MKKLILFLFCTLTILYSSTVYAQPTSGLIRVGLVALYNNVSTISIKNNEILVGYERNDGFISAHTFRAESSFQIKYTNEYYIEMNQRFFSYNEAWQMAESYNNMDYNAIPTLLESNQWTVFIGGFSTEEQAQTAKNSISDSVRVISLSGLGIILADGTKDLALFYNENEFVQIATANEEVILLGDRSYRGRIEFTRNPSSITAINIIDLEEYLRSVVPSEMPASWNQEALKAQTIAARTYTLNSMRGHIGSNYDLCDTIHCQVYTGTVNEHDSTDRAVLETRGKLIYHDNQIIDAVYFSSSGGSTENSEDVWTNEFPYLRSRLDTYETTGRQWTRTFTRDDIARLLANRGVNIGEVIGMEIVSLTETGRVSELIIIGTNSTESLTRETVRTFFSGSEGGSLESRNFRITNLSDNPSADINYATVNAISAIDTNVVGFDSVYVISANSSPTRISNTAVTEVHLLSNNTSQSMDIQSTTPSTGIISSDVFVFEGSGWGHGVGMSQHGANGMANAGYNYEQILKHYYTGVEIR